MDKYYDDKCPQCEQGCHWFGFGKYTDGAAYEKCDFYGYILHRFVYAECPGYTTEIQWKIDLETERLKSKGKKK